MASKQRTLLYSTLLIALAVFCCASYSAGFAAIGIDFGTESFKVGMIQSTGIDLILNAQSGRKTVNSVGFDDKGERVFADAAARISARSPERIVYAAQRLLARPLSHPVVKLQQKRYHFQLEESKRGSVDIVIDKNNTFLPEEIVGMILENVQSMATNRLKSGVKDVVITVPPMFTEHERQGLIDGLKLAGLNPLALINEGSAVAQQWALSRDIPEEELNIVFYDFGAGTLKATLAGFRTVNESVPPSSKTKPVPQIIIKAVTWDESVGGIDFDLCLADYIADLVNKKRPGTPDIRESTRAMVKINKVARTIKEILSANQAYLLSIEGLIGDYDFSTTITRQEFEQACSSVFEKILSPLERVIAEANLTIADIHGVEAIGGSIRIPKVQEIIKNYLGKELDHHLNGDEAAVFGATFYSAVLSPGFKVQTEYRLKDIIQYEIGLKIESTDKDALAEGEEGVHQDILFRKGKRLTSKRTVSFRMSTNFTVDLHYTENDAPANTPSAIKQFTFTNVPSNVVNMTEKPRISLTFQLNRNGMVELVRSEAEVGVMSWEERIVNKTTTTESKTADKTESKTEAQETKETKEAEDTPKTEEAAAGENSTKSEPEYEVVGELVKKTRKFNLRYTTTYPNIKPLSDEEYRSAQAKLRLWNRKDQARRDREEARNNLESYIYSTKERLYDEDFISASTEEERETLSTKLTEFGDWIYEDGEDAEASEYRKKLREVKDIGDAVQFRLDEVTQRPEAAQFLRKSIEAFRGILANLTVTHNLTQTDIVDALEQSTDEEEWINEKEKEQETKSITDKPAFTSTEAVSRGNNLKNTISQLMRRPKKKPPPPPKKSPTKKASSSSTNKDEDPTASSTTNEEATQAEETPEQPQTEEQQKQQQPEAGQQQQQHSQESQTDEQKIQEEIQTEAENVQL